MTLDLSSLEKASESLNRAAAYVAAHINASSDATHREVLRAGVIQNFEFTYELCWKFIKRWLEFNISPNSAEGISRRELFRLAAENLLIEDVENWMRFHEARNLTSHTYDQTKSEEVFAIAMSFVAEADKLLKALKKQND